MPDVSKAWSVNQLRLTGFLTPTVKVEGADWWQKLTGESPETVVDNPRVATRQVQGTLSGGSLTLQINPIRVDWLLTAPPPEGLVSTTATVGAWTTVSPMFLDLMKKWLTSSDCPALLRLAFGAVLVLPTASRESGYEVLNEYLTAVKLDTTNTSDFSYQINRPRSSTTLKGVKINRLTKWSVAAMQSFVAAPSGLAMGGAEHSVRLELDINTAPESLTEIPKPALVELLYEMLSLAEEIAAEGEKS